MEELCYLVSVPNNPRDVSEVSTVKTTFKHCNETIMVLAKFGRRAHQVTRYCPHAFIIAVTCNPQTANQECVYCDIFLVCVV